MTITQGIHTISAEDYHADPCPEPSLSASIANRLLSQSPAHARIAHPRLNPDYAPEESDRFDLGSAAHALLLENDSSRITWIDAPDFRSGTARAAKIDARAHGKLPVLTKYQDVLHAMVKAARQAVAQSEFAGLFDSGQAEQTVVWFENNANFLDPAAKRERAAAGIWLRCRPDWWSGDKTIVLDYKTAASAAPEQFIRQIGNMAYDLAAEFYLRGMAQHGAKTYVFLAQELEPPFACSLHTLGSAYREIAQEKVERAIQVWRMCIQSGQWPAYTLKLHHAEPPAWEMAAFEARMAQENW